MPRRQFVQPSTIFSAILTLTLAIGLFGGASRPDVATNAIVQLFGLGLAVLLWIGWYNGFGAAPTSRGMRGWIALLLLTTLWMILQLVPLPPAIWTALPGRFAFVTEAATVGINQPWRPISLSPMSTWLSLVGTTVPIGLISTWGWFSREQLRAGRWVLAAILIISVLFGLAQVSGGMGGGLYLFDNGSPGFPAGLFANRNHQAAALSMTFPLLGAAVVEARITRQWVMTTIVGACIAACLVLPLLLVNGSRAGLLLAGMTIALTLLMVATFRLPGRTPVTPRQILLMAAAVVLPFAIAGLAFILGRAAAIERLTRLRIADDQRYRQAETVFDMIWTYFPVGAGYGSFPQVFRLHEPFTSLKLTYFNHAHNDLIELAFEGGIVALLLALVAAGLFVGQSWRVWTTTDRGRTTLYARTATIMIAALVVASAGDYPLRTPTIVVFAAIALAWLSAGADVLKSR